MNFRTAIVLVATLRAAFVAAEDAALAIDSAFGARWILDPAKSTFATDPSTFAALPGGKMRSSTGQTISFTFACDGKSYATMSDSTASCVKAGSLAYRFTYVNGGKTTGIETRLRRRKSRRQRCGAFQANARRLQHQRIAVATRERSTDAGLHILAPGQENRSVDRGLREAVAPRFMNEDACSTARTVRLQNLLPTPDERGLTSSES